MTLCNGRGIHDTSTAELALTLILASLRGIPDWVRAQDRHEWPIDKLWPFRALLGGIYSPAAGGISDLPVISRSFDREVSTNVLP